MSDASAMVERCGRHQHPELFSGRPVAPAGSTVAREIAAMTTDRGPVDREESDAYIMTPDEARALYARVVHP